MCDRTNLLPIDFPGFASSHGCNQEYVEEEKQSYQSGDSTDGTLNLASKLSD